MRSYTLQLRMYSPVKKRLKRKVTSRLVGLNRARSDTLCLVHAAVERIAVAVHP
jgi:hypothetical protein